MTDARELRFPVDAIPPEAPLARLVGLYPMRQEGLFMQRVRIHAGTLSPEDLRSLARIAREYTPGYPLHLTTRQDVELHGVKPADVGAVQHALAAAGMTGLGSCGDTLRNVTACRGAGLCADSVDVSGVAAAVREAAEAMPWIRTMPRKFKIAISGCNRACARPYINDIGLIAEADGTYRAVVAGSLGPRPATGIPLEGVFDEAGAVALVVAALTLFITEGDRKNRGSARLRHVRERLGDAAFVDRLHALVDGEKSSRRRVPLAAPGRQSTPEAACLRPPLGDIEPDDAVALADAVEAAGAIIRIGIEHELRIYAKGAVALPKAVEAWRGNACGVVACPGTTWCSRGIADARAAGAAIREAMPRDVALGVQISGCPNNCAQSAVADIGLVGRIKTIGGVRTECFKLTAGGGKGRGPGLGVELSEAVPAQRVAEIVALLAEECRNFRQGRDVEMSEFIGKSWGRLSEIISRRIGSFPAASDQP